MSILRTENLFVGLLINVALYGENNIRRDKPVELPPPPPTPKILHIFGVELPHPNTQNITYFC